MNPAAIAHGFFESYARALLNHDAAAIAEHYAVPALILLPDHPVAFSSIDRVREFFEQTIAGYDGVKDNESRLTVVTATERCLWVDVEWNHHGGAPSEHWMYQLTRTPESWRVVVQTPLGR